MKIQPDHWPRGGVAKRALTYRYLTWPIILFWRHTSAGLGGIYDWLSEETLLPRSNIVFHIGALPSLSFPPLLAVPATQEPLLLAASAMNGDPALLRCGHGNVKNFISVYFSIGEITSGFFFRFFLRVAGKEGKKEKMQMVLAVRSNSVNVAMSMLFCSLRVELMTS